MIPTRTNDVYNQIEEDQLNQLHQHQHQHQQEQQPQILMLQNLNNNQHHPLSNQIQHQQHFQQSSTNQKYLRVQPSSSASSSKPKSKRFVSRPLQRNQACTTCRSRKVRCDAQKPACGACKRSAAAHGEDSSLVVCHYDSEDHLHYSNHQNNNNHNRNNSNTTKDRSSNNYNRFDSSNGSIKIHNNDGSNDNESRSNQDQGPSKPSTKVAILEQKIAELEKSISELELTGNSYPLTDNYLNFNNNNQQLLQSNNLLIESSGSSIQSSLNNPISMDSIPNDFHQISQYDWPLSLPNRSYTIRMISIYFNQPLRGFGQVQFIDPSSFIQRLYLPYYHPLFPNLALIHSMFLKTYQSNKIRVSPSSSEGGRRGTGGKRRRMKPWFRFNRIVYDSLLRFQAGKYWSDPKEETQNDENCNGKSRIEEYREHQQGRDNYYDDDYWDGDGDDDMVNVEEYHSKFFKKFVDQGFFTETGIFEIIQAINIYCYYAFEAGKLVEAWIYSGLSIRFCAPLGLNFLEAVPDSNFQKPKPKPKIILKPPISTTEKYERASTFWYCFQIDRILSVCSGKPHSISEEDISSLLPVKPGTFLSSLEPISSLTSHPLSISNPMILNCPFQSISSSSNPFSHKQSQPQDPNTMISSVLNNDNSLSSSLSLEEELKCLELIGTLILGRVTDWLRRSVDPVGFNLKKVWKVPQDGCIPDLRKTIGFIELDEEIQIFKMSMRPKTLEDLYEPITSSTMDLMNENNRTGEEGRGGFGNYDDDDGDEDGKRLGSKKGIGDFGTGKRLSNSKIMIKLILNLSEILLNECFMSREPNIFQEGLGSEGNTDLKVDDQGSNFFRDQKDGIDGGEGSGKGFKIFGNDQDVYMNELTNAKIERGCDGIIEVFEELLKHNEDNNKLRNMRKIKFGRSDDEIEGEEDELDLIDFRNDLNPFSYFCWMVGMRNLMRFLVKNEIELIELDRSLKSLIRKIQESSKRKKNTKTSLNNPTINERNEDRNFNSNSKSNYDGFDLEYKDDRVGINEYEDKDDGYEGDEGLERKIKSLREFMGSKERLIEKNLKKIERFVNLIDRISNNKNLNKNNNNNKNDDDDDKIGKFERGFYGEGENDCDEDEREDRTKEELSVLLGLKKNLKEDEGLKESDLTEEGGVEEEEEEGSIKKFYVEMIIKELRGYDLRMTQRTGDDYHYEKEGEEEGKEEGKNRDRRKESFDDDEYDEDFKIYDGSFLKKKGKVKKGRKIFGGLFDEIRLRRFYVPLKLYKVL